MERKSDKSDKGVAPAAPTTSHSVPPPNLAAQSARSALRCALFNDGALYIETDGGGKVELEKEEVRDLVDYLNKISGVLRVEVVA